MPPESIVRECRVQELFHKTVQVTPDIYRLRTLVAKSAIELHHNREVIQPKELLGQMLDEYAMRASLNLSHKDMDFIQVWVGHKGR